ncbi:MAG: bifunctional hydroxymethylpyrimidine kinase/phosphomethylpyrimidine kinase [Rickettsiales bacterium]|jgi:hydroxymethylpyrimidine/phosphomethylpyrimidine kinase|nr:bifunctional hydroxymethylpyrimidine kinase/phosphomethylpyrimidine kinase [Rickettsiales bacterium]
MKNVLSIAGSDCSGGAGIQADLKTFLANGVFGMSVIVSVVAENTFRVLDIQNVTQDMIKNQIDAVFEDIPVDAVKVGMLSSIGCMNAVAEKLKQYSPVHVVVDPVMYAKNGCALMEEDAIGTLIEVVIPLATLITPNIPEAEKITGMKINSIDDMKKAAKLVLNFGCKAVLLKGGHLDGDAVDILYDGESFNEFKAKRIDTKNTHGTGCTYSSAIASNLALGFNLVKSISNSKEYITEAIENSLNIGKGHGPVNHFYKFFK